MKKKEEQEEGMINCLRNEIIEVRFIPQDGKVTDKAHVLYGGMGENSRFVVSVPRLRSGSFVDVLTKDEKKFLEYTMGLEDGALSIYNKVDNFWSNSSDKGISKVILQKRDNRLNLSNPEDYIRYKILLANKDLIAKNIQELQDRPKATYRFVLVSNNDTNVTARTQMNYKKQAYIEYGKIETNEAVLKIVIELLAHKPVAKNTKLEILQEKVGELIEENPKDFLNTVKDSLLPYKILIQDAVQAGIISKRSDLYFLRKENTPLCEDGEDATLTVAARFLSNPKRQELKFSIEEKLKKKEE